jgi:hypothetical protein
MTTICRTIMNYAAQDGGLREVEVDIRDGRAARLPGWRECGFEIVRHTSSVATWTDDDEIASVHYPEVESVARTLTGCEFALVSDHVRRTAEQAKGERDQAPVRLVHSDFAAGYDEIVRTAYRDVRGRGAATLARNGLSADRIEAARRVIMMQFWRNVGPAKMDSPVAFCDARTITPAEGRPFRYTGYVAGGQAFDALAVVAPDGPPEHGWYTFPEMTPDEVVAFRTYDTELVRDGKTYFTPHSAFPDPDVDAGQPARVSVELRVMCLFM